MIEELARGKINLALCIQNKRDDGYHEIDTVFQSISLADSVYIEEDDHLELSCNWPELACDETNLAYQAAVILQRYCGVTQGARISIHKRLPLAAGLAGGSSDAAAVLRGLNTCWQTELPLSVLTVLGAQVGSDVPFCLNGGTMRGGGRGEKLQVLPDFSGNWLLIVHPKIAVHTKIAYDAFDLADHVCPIDVDGMVTAVIAGGREGVINKLGNTFEELIIPKVPEIRQCKLFLQDKGLRPLMSGSGPTVFAFIDNPQIGYELQQEVEKKRYNWDVLVTKTVQREN